MENTFDLTEMPTEVIFAIIATLSPCDLISFALAHSRFWDIVKKFAEQKRSLQLFAFEKHRHVYLQTVDRMFSSKEMAVRWKGNWLALFLPCLNQNPSTWKTLPIISSKWVTWLFLKVEHLEVFVSEPIIDVHNWLTCRHWSSQLTSLSLNALQAKWSMSKYERCFKAINELSSLQMLHLFYIRHPLPAHWPILGRLQEFTLHEYRYRLEPIFTQLGPNLRNLRLGHHQELSLPVLYFRLLQQIHAESRAVLSHLSLAFVTDSISVSLLSQFCSTFNGLQCLDLSGHFAANWVCLTHLTAVLEQLSELTNLKMAIESFDLPEMLENREGVEDDDIEDEDQNDPDALMCFQKIEDIVIGVDLDEEGDDSLVAKNGEEIDNSENCQIENKQMVSISDNQAAAAFEVGEDIEVMNDRQINQQMIAHHLDFMDIRNPLQITAIVSLRTLTLTGEKVTFRNFTRWDLLAVAFPQITRLNFHFNEHQDPEIENHFLLKLLQQRVAATFGKQLEVTEE